MGVFLDDFLYIDLGVGLTTGDSTKTNNKKILKAILALDLGEKIKTYQIYQDIMSEKDNMV